MTTTQAQFTIYLNQFTADWNRPAAASGRPESNGTSDRLVANRLLNDDDFQVLGLGTIFSSPSDEFIDEAVSAVRPVLYVEDTKLLTEAVKIAVRDQQLTARARAGAVGIGVAILALIISSVIKSHRQKIQ